MSGAAGIRLPWVTSEAVGIYPSERGLLLARLCSTEERGGAWTLTESRVSEGPCPAPADAAALSLSVREEILRAGWAKLPLSLALPSSEAHTEERTLPVQLTGTELREALLWSLRAETDEAETPLSDEMRLCCMELPDAAPPCYWTARMEERRIRGYFSAFAAAGLDLRRLTVCPPTNDVLAAQIEGVCAPRMPWETTEEDMLAPAVYAGLLVRTGMPEHLYWSAPPRLIGALRPQLPVLIAVLAAALFLVQVTADLAACVTARTACAHAEEELALRQSERLRMEEFFALHSAVMEREQLLAEFTAASLPARALLVHLGAVTVEGVQLTGIYAEEHGVRIEGDAADYAVLAAWMGTMEEDAFFPADIMLEQAVQEQSAADAPEHIHFVLHSSW